MRTFVWRGLVIAMLALLASPAAAARFEAATCAFPVPRNERATCGYVAVPTDRSVEVSPELRLYVAVLHSSAATPLPDPVIFINGGPGAATFAEGSVDLWWADSRLLRADRDFILFDQRGVGLSEPSLDCPEMDGVADAAWRRDLGPAEAIALEWPAAMACRTRLGQEGIDLAAYGTSEGAADVDDVALALGYPRYNIVAVSYGTRVALGVMRRFEEGVRSAVLDSVYPPGISDLESRPALTARLFRQIFDDCAAQARCLGSFPGMEQRVKAMMDRLQAMPERAMLDDNAVPLTVDSMAVGEAVRLAATDPATIPRLPAMLWAATRGDFAPIAPWIGPGFFAGPELAEGMALSVECSENFPFADRGRLAQSLLRSAPYGLAGAYALEWTICEGWDVPPVAPLDVIPVSSEIPTLLLSGSYDPITPPEYAFIAAATLGNARVVAFRAGTHSLFATDACARLIAARFIADPGARPADLCPERALPPRFTPDPVAEGSPVYAEDPP
jgi:pimeloyl-ACP methyl ester carboxylesterase